MNKLSVIFLCIVVGLGSYIGGFACGNIFSATQGGDNNNSLISKLASLPEGAEITINENELGKVVTEKEYNGATSEKIYFRGMSWFGLGGPEAAAGDQGISHDDMTVGKSKGRSWIAGLWNFVKSIFWFLVLYIVVWLLCSALSVVYPPLAIVASIMAAVATGGLSLLGKLFDWIKTKKVETALVQTVQGIESYKAANPESKAAINNELKIAQDSNSKDLVDAIRK